MRIPQIPAIMIEMLPILLAQVGQIAERLRHLRQLVAIEIQPASTSHNTHLNHMHASHHHHSPLHTHTPQPHHFPSYRSGWSDCRATPAPQTAGCIEIQPASTSQHTHLNHMHSHHHSPLHTLSPTASHLTRSGCSQVGQIAERLRHLRQLVDSGTEPQPASTSQHTPQSHALPSSFPTPHTHTSAPPLPILPAQVGQIAERLRHLRQLVATEIQPASTSQHTPQSHALPSSFPTPHTHLSPTASHLTTLRLVRLPSHSGTSDSWLSLRTSLRAHHTQHTPQSHALPSSFPTPHTHTPQPHRFPSYRLRLVRLPSRQLPAPQTAGLPCRATPDQTAQPAST